MQRLNVNDNFWQQSQWGLNTYPTKPNDKITHTVAQQLINQRFSLAKLPTIENQAITHNGKGKGYTFFKGSDSLPNIENHKPILGESDARSLVEQLKADSAYWDHIFNRSGFLDNDSRAQKNLSYYQNIAISYLVSGELSAYEFKHSPPTAKPQETEYVDYHHRPSTLGPLPDEPVPQSEIEPDNNTPKLDSGEKGNWNKILNGELKPNHKYEVGAYIYETDDLGRVNRVTGELELEKNDRSPYQQGKAGKEGGIKDGLNDDEGGHLIACIFNGPGEQVNYAAMDGNLNKGAWKRMENKWAEALKKDPPDVVKVEIETPCVRLVVASNFY